MKVWKVSIFLWLEVQTMLNLFNAYFSRLAKWKVFHILMFTMLAGGIAIAMVSRKHQFVFQLPFTAAGIIFPIYIGVVTGLFNYPVFTNGTIRNQLAVGHKRSHIFFADWAASNVFSIVLYLILAVSIDVVAAIDGTAAGDVSWKNVISGLVISSLHIMLFTTITQLFCAMLKGVRSFLAIYLGNQLLVLAGAAIMTVEKVPKAVLYFFPTVVTLNLDCFDTASALNPVTEGIAASADALTFQFLPAAGAIILEIAVVFLIGTLYFRKTDFN